MKITPSKLIRSKRGQGLVIVLCLLAIGSLTIPSLLSHMHSGLRSGRIHWESVPLQYASEAGLEDGIWKADNEEVSIDLYDYVTEYDYSLTEEINDKAVDVTIKRVWPLAGLESDVNGTTPANGLRITGGIVNTEGRYEVRASYDFPEEELLVDQIAVWLPPGFEYVNDSTTIITTDNPTQTDWNGGTVLRWAINPATNFLDLPDLGGEDPLGGGFQPAVQYPTVKVLRFEVTPQGEAAIGSYSWIRTTDSSRYLSWEGGLSIYHISSTATDVPSGRSITTTGYTYVSEGVDTGWLDTGGSIFTGDYRAVGNTLMKDLNWDRRRETHLDESSMTIADIPQDGEVALAYLYWSGWWNQNAADTTCTFKIEHASEMLRPNNIGEYTQCAPMGDVENYQCVDDVVSDEDSTYVRTGHEFDIFRPSGNGTYTQCDPVGDYYNYRCVDDEVADGDYTYVRTWYGGTEMDTYQLEGQSHPLANIISVTVCVRTKATSTGHAAETVIRTHGVNYFGTYTVVPTSYTDLSKTYTENPYTGNVWNWSEVVDLEAGVRHHDLNGGYLCTTQVYVGVEYGTSAGGEQMDTYNLENPGEGSETIQSVTMHARTKSNLCEDTHAAETVIRTHDTDYFGTYTLLPVTYTDLSTTYETNPYTGVAWTWEEINALQAGVKHYDLGLGGIYTTQVYIEVDYGAFYEDEITADTWWIVPNQSHNYAYSSFKDVSSIVAAVAPNGNATYTVGGVDGDTGSELSYAGWSLIVIYSSIYEEGHQFYLYDTLTYAAGSASVPATGGFVIEGFTAPQDAEATLTCFVGEGDYWYDGDSLQFNGYYMSDAINPEDDVWNSTSSALGGELIEGVDIDTFDVSSPIINPEDTSAQVDFITYQDAWNLIYLILSFRCDFAVLTPSSTGIYSFGF